MSIYVSICKKKKKYSKPGIRGKVLNEDTGPDFLFAQLKPEGDNWRCGNIDLLKRTNLINTWGLQIKP